jgi:hypothetical protein
MQRPLLATYYIIGKEVVVPLQIQLRQKDGKINRKNSLAKIHFTFETIFDIHIKKYIKNLYK